MSICSFIKRGLERRRAPRFEAEDLVVHYWTGGAPGAKPVRDVGLYGACIQAPEVFYPGTILQIVLEDRAAHQDHGTSQHICLYAKIIRPVEGGFCVAFLFADGAERKKVRRFLEVVKRAKAPAEPVEAPAGGSAA